MGGHTNGGKTRFVPIAPGKNLRAGTYRALRLPGAIGSKRDLASRLSGLIQNGVRLYET